MRLQLDPTSPTGVSIAPEVAKTTNKGGFAGSPDITRVLQPGTNVTFMGSGTQQSPYIVNATGGGGGGESWSPGTAVESPNGVIVTFTVPATYIAGSLLVFLNGIRESHFTEASTTTFTFSTAPLAGDEITLFYRTA